MCFNLMCGNLLNCWMTRRKRALLFHSGHILFSYMAWCLEECLPSASFAKIFWKSLRINVPCHGSRLKFCSPDIKCFILVHKCLSFCKREIWVFRKWLSTQSGAWVFLHTNMHLQRFPPRPFSRVNKPSFRVNNDCKTSFRVNNDCKRPERRWE